MAQHLTPFESATESSFKEHKVKLLLLLYVKVSILERASPIASLYNVYYIHHCLYSVLDTILYNIFSQVQTRKISLLSFERNFPRNWLLKIHSTK